MNALVHFAWAAALSLGLAAPDPAAEFLEPDQLSQMLKIEQVQRTDTGVQGVLVNHGGTEIRDVRLAVRYDYRWPNEFKPGSADPSWVEFHTLVGPIAPGGRLEFQLARERTEPQREGHFETQVQILSFAELVKS